ncbi:MAG TPA: ribosome rescue GTPase HflX [Pseudomonadales bacterium]
MFFERPEAGRKAVLLQVNLKGADSGATHNSAAECAELARTARIDVVGQVTANRPAPDPRWYVGEGKLAELETELAAREADLLLANHELSPRQQRNLEQRLRCRVMTRTELILHIFADRARTYEGQLQVELAQLNHAQTRLVRGWTHLDRQKGGIGLRGGAGETQLELDQRMIAERIKALQKKLEAVATRRGQGRRRRQRGHVRTVSLVGYTNAGKSTLFNALTHAGVTAEDKLFATLDPTMRRLPVPGVGDVVLADTVGFISNLPHSLVDAFKATLEEVASADLLLHVVDAGAEDVDARIRQVNAVLDEIGARDLPTIMVFNKMDTLPGGVPAGHGSAVAVSGRTGEGLPALVAAIGERLGVSAPVELLLRPDEGRTRAWLYSMGAVLDEQTREDGSLALTVQADADVLARLDGAHHHGRFVAPPQGQP